MAWTEILHHNTTIAALGTLLINNLQANGFVLKYVNAGSTSDVSPNITATKATLESGSGVDPLYATQPWRIQIDAATSASVITFYLGTSTQLPDAGTTTGSVNCPSLNTASYAFPWSIYVAVSNHGFSIYATADNLNAGYNTIFGVQRLVNRTTGATLTTNHSPVIGFTQPVAGGATQASILREDDTVVPTAWANIYTPNSRIIAPINTIGATQPSYFTDYNNNFLVFNISGICTPRFIYLEDLDHFLWCSANAFNTHNDLVVDAYGGSRTYFTCVQTYAGYGRVLVLKSGGGV